MERKGQSRREYNDAVVNRLKVSWKSLREGIALSKFRRFSRVGLRKKVSAHQFPRGKNSPERVLT